MKNDTPPSLPKIVHDDLSATQQCVMCGMCVPHCPTYVLSQNEADGPRGRIALLLGLAQDRLSLDAEAVEHLDGCLSCRACEQVCPSKVPYGSLIDAGRAHMLAAQPRHGQWMRGVRDELLLRPVRLRVLSGVVRMAQKLRMDRLPMPASIRRLSRLAPPLTAPFRPHEVYPHAYPRGRVGLFLGCMGSVFEAENLRAAVSTLNAWGFEVHIPTKQGCCGAMHQHGGDPERGQRMADDVAQLFAALELDAIVGVSSGCVAQLKEHGKLKAKPGAKLGIFELSDFLLQQQPSPLPFMHKLEKRVAVHLPCTQRNILRTGNNAIGLLRLIPGLEVIELPGNERCCGAAGTHMLTHPQQADTLREPKIEAFAALNATYMVSTNIGCAMHLGAGLRETDARAEVIHPVRLLAEALGNQA